MNLPRRIVLCGNSIYMLAIEEGLTALLGSEVLRLNAYLPDAGARITALKPTAVVLELGGDGSQFVQELCRQGFPVLTLDFVQGVLTVLTGGQLLECNDGEQFYFSTEKELLLNILGGLVEASPSQQSYLNMKKPPQ